MLADSTKWVNGNLDNVPHRLKLMKWEKDPKLWVSIYNVNLGGPLNIKRVVEIIRIVT